MLELEDKDQCKDKKNIDDYLSNDKVDGQEADNLEEQLTDDKNQGVHRSKRNNKGTTAMYADYSLMMNTR
jgi:hypothetical protein